ncbi:MAG TPA: SDR family NAD(P)-dependent oxidoreductase [Oscillatoriaceae cyanobacterium]
MRVLLTGGAGFIGSHSAECLLAQGAQVVVYDNLSTGRLDNLQKLSGKLHFVHGDLRDYARLEQALRGCDAVLHLAAVVSVPESIAQPLFAHEINASGTLNVLEAARKLGVPRVVLASSAAVYGANAALPLREEAPPQPLSPYAAQKWLGESYASNYARLHGLSTIALRYFNVYGPRQDPASPYSGVLSRFIQATLAGAPVTIFGDGRQTRDFVYVEDVARANAAAVLAKTTGATVLNVGTGQAVDLIAALDAIVAHSEKPPLPPTFGPPREGDIRHSLADVRRAEELLGFRARTAFSEGIARTIAWSLASPACDDVSVLFSSR